MDDQPLIAVGRPDANSIALADAGGDLRSRRELDLSGQLVVCRAIVLVADDQRLAGAEALGDEPKPLANRFLEERRIGRSLLARGVDRGVHDCLGHNWLHR